MLKLFAFIFTGCWHKYEHVNTNPLNGDGGGRGVRYTFKCKRCGKYKKQDLI